MRAGRHLRTWYRGKGCVKDSSNMFALGVLLLATLVAGQYDYSEVLHKSILFYEAQRAGPLPDSNRIPWRGDSAMTDGDDVGVDLKGGWYDAGDHVKFGYPMANSVSMLAWGMIEFEDGYRAAGEWENAVDCIRWPLDYFINAHVHPWELYGQVGDGYVDHEYWGRPEDMTMERPAWSIWSPDGPGSELAGETAAAMAASSIIYRDTVGDENFANELLQHAREIYDLAYDYRGIYTDTITNARDFYASWNGYNDELCWGAAWLYYATGEDIYREKAYEFADPPPGDTVSWFDKYAGCHLVLYKLTGNQVHVDGINNILNNYFPGGAIHHTPLGLAWVDDWGPLRYAANMAMYSLIAAEYGFQPEASREFARSQIHYMLGSTGRSFVIGFGNNPPQSPHHRASSCPDMPASCTWDDYFNPGPNPQTLNGALVGGPDRDDNYNDDRSDYMMNEVGCDYNAGFQGAIAGLISIGERGL